MSYYAIIDDTPRGDVATTSGWWEFGEWADTLDLDKYNEIVVLSEHGLSDKPLSLARQLAAAIVAAKPSRDVASIAAGLIKIIAASSTTDDDGVIVISDGA